MKHIKQLLESGKTLAKAKKALILIHGRGASSSDILSLKDDLSVDDFYVVAPQAINNTWYPYSFLAPIEENEPWLSSAVKLIHSITEDITNAGLTSDKIYIAGFSQGACLALEFATRHAQKWGGVIAFTGGLIGENIVSESYKGDFKGTQVFIGNSDIDPHVPKARSEESRCVMEKMGAVATLKIYPNMAHTIIKDEVDSVNRLFFN
jgi:phospholipase/carboxylesterase